jgi:hypothetical protein
MLELIEKVDKPKLNSLLIGAVLLVIGIFLFALSVFTMSQIFSLIGLGLTFWGVLLLLTPPPKHIEASYLVTCSLPDYLTIDRMLRSISAKNESFNIPPCPKDVNLPEHLEGLKQMVTFIPAEGTGGLAEIEDIARGNFLIENPKGLLIASPGTGILDRMEQISKQDFTKIPINELCEVLPSLLHELYLAKNIRMTLNEENFLLEITNSLYNKLYSENYNLKSVNILGCPLVNAAACAIAKSAGKPTVIQGIKINGKTITATLKIVDIKFEVKKKSNEVDETISLRRNELLESINSSIVIVDLSFNILFALHQKHINWELLEEYSKHFGEYYNFDGQSMPPFSLDFFRISSAINRKVAKDTSKEAHVLVKAVYEYFNALDLNDDFQHCIPNYISAKAIISSYIALNDLLFCKVVNQKINAREQSYLKSLLQILSYGTNFKVDFNNLMSSFNRLIPENELEGFINDTRELFKQQLTNFSEVL